MIQDIADVDWMLRADVQWAYAAICAFGLTFDTLGFPRHLPNFLTLMKRYPDLRVVIDHGMKPAIRSQNPADFATWADGMARIAGETAALCKLSGLITKAGPSWTAARLRPFVDHILRVFGPDRMM